MLAAFLKKAVRWVRLGGTRRAFGKGRRALDADEIAQALRLKGLGLSDRRVAALTGLHRSTVRRLWLTSGSVEEIMERLAKRHLRLGDWETLAERYLASRLEGTLFAGKDKEH